MRHGDVLDKLVQLNTRCPKMVDHIYHLAVTSSDCRAALKDLEEVAAVSRNSQTKPGDTSGSAEKSKLIDTEIIELLATNREVCETLLREPKLSTEKQHVLVVLAAIADVHPGDHGTLITRDGPLAYMLTLVVGEEETAKLEGLTQSFVNRLIELNGKVKPLLTALHEYCGRPDYREIVNEFDAWLDTELADGGPPQESSAEFQRLSSLCKSMLVRPLDRSVLYGAPRVSQIPYGFIQAFPLNESPAVDETDSGSSLQVLQRRAKYARETLEAMQAGNPELKSAVELRLDAAIDSLARRRFVKAQVLEFGWPRLLSYVRAPGGQRRLLELERAVREPARRRALSARWQEFLVDERLVEFLSMPPYFGEMSRAPEFTGSEFGTPGDVAADGDVPELEVTAVAPGGAGDESVQLDQYADVHLTLTALDDELSGVTSGAVSTGDVLPASLELSFAGRRSKVDVSIPVGKVGQLLAALSYAYGESNAQPHAVARIAVTDAEPLPPPDLILEDIGSRLWNALMVDAQEHNSILDFIAAEKRVRFVITYTGRHLGDMPWECLYIPALQLFAGLTLRISVVRNVRPKSLVRREIDDTMRVLLVSALPRDTPWLNADQEITLIRRVLEPAERLGVLRVDELKNPDEERLQGQLRLFRPHVFHFIGHGGIGRDGQGAVLLADENGAGVEVNATRIGTLLRERGILVAVLNSCFTGIVHSDIARSVASVLVQEGVPLAIAPSRAVLDRAALQFAREFYTALMDGYPIEAAVVEARKLLSVKGWDWSTYLTYSTERSRKPEFWPRLSVR